MISNPPVTCSNPRVTYTKHIQKTSKCSDVNTQKQGNIIS